VHYGAGGGAFQPETVLRSGGLTPASVLLSDLDADGRPDLAAANQATGNVSTWPSAAAGAGTRLDFGAGSGAWRMVSADLNGDGRVDLVAPTSRGVVVLLNQGPFPAHDTDRDGIPDDRDNCPTVPNADQDPRACDERLVALSLRLTVGAGPSRVTWSVTHEVDLAGFHLVTVARDGASLPVGGALVPCRVCTGGGAADYSADVPRRLAGRDLYVDMVRSDGSVLRAGPAAVVRPSPRSGAPRRAAP
jgi:hypothetical protein